MCRLATSSVDKETECEGEPAGAVFADVALLLTETDMVTASVSSLAFLPPFFFFFCLPILPRCMSGSSAWEELDKPRPAVVVVEAVLVRLPTCSLRKNLSVRRRRTRKNITIIGNHSTTRCPY